MEKEFIDWAKTIIGDADNIEKEPHGDEGVVYKITTATGSYFLKIRPNSTSPQESEKTKWLRGKVPVPDVVGFTVKDGNKALLTTALEGKNLAVLCKEWPAEKVTDTLADVLRTFHATSTAGWPFDTSDINQVLVHGDACLPNFIFNGDQLSGYIDLGDARLATPEVDLAATIWSLEYNLGTGHGVHFLKKYGHPNATEEEAERLRLQYVTYQQAHGFL